ncbi:transcription termination factor 4, mitochondrial [Leuresthes tenuis]|uniref:transcription termination factor 4, mitochondrial n=1 Tax=Leuresthes tenuis TaxID=355514 RepID=UPI003B500430
MRRTNMGTNVVHMILRLTLRNVRPSVFSPLRLRRHHLSSLCMDCRRLCSSDGQTASQSTQHSHELASVSGQPSTELSLRSLTDMGFTDCQAGRIFEAASSLRGGSVAKHVLSTLTVLFVLGLNPTSVLKMLDKCPELYTVKEAQLQQRISNLRKLGLVEGSLQRMVVHYPKILALRVKSVKNVVMFLREKCLFTAQQVTDILRDSPAVALEDLGELEYKFQYVYFRMGVKQREMVKCRLFRLTLDEVRCRHSFLERRGLYQTPDKKGQTTIVNPKLDSVLNVDRDTFVTHVAQASAEEYDVFQKLLAREWKEEGLQQGRIEADDDGDDDDDDEAEEEEETGGKSSYMKRKKKKQ